MNDVERKFATRPHAPPLRPTPLLVGATLPQDRAVSYAPQISWVSPRRDGLWSSFLQLRPNKGGGGRGLEKTVFVFSLFPFSINWPTCALIHPAHPRLGPLIHPSHRPPHARPRHRRSRGWGSRHSRTGRSALRPAGRTDTGRRCLPTCRRSPSRSRCPVMHHRPRTYPVPRCRAAPPRSRHSSWSDLCPGVSILIFVIRTGVT
jgi:hypothetical protein